MEEEVNEDLLTVHEFWRKFTVKHAVDHLMKAWEGLNVATIRHGWLKLAPHLVPPITQPIQQSRDVLAAAVQEARLVPGFGDVAEDDLLEIHAGGEEATEEDIMSAAAVEDTLQQEPQQQPTDDAAPKDLSMHQVSSILAVIDILKSTIAENEICEVRKAEMIQGAEQTFRYYFDLHIQKQNKLKQALITKFVRPNVRPNVSDDDDEPAQPVVLDPAVPSTSNVFQSLPSLEELFTEDDMEEFEGFLGEDG
ncbi:uncharacterized protein [Palaemon carinicauda]